MQDCILRNHRFIFKTNFALSAEREGRFKSNFPHGNIVLDNEEAEMLANEGMKIGTLTNPDTQENTYHADFRLSVNGKRKPIVYLVINGARCKLELDNLAEIDAMQDDYAIDHIDVSFHTYKAEGAQWAHAYIDSLYVYAKKPADPFAAEFETAQIEELERPF